MTLNDVYRCTSFSTQKKFLVLAIIVGERQNAGEKDENERNHRREGKKAFLVRKTFELSRR
jgi:hypothetical protein